MNIFNKFPQTFWVANLIELFERWAWYGFYMLFANYLTGSLDDGGLQFSNNEKALIMGAGTGILYFLPVLTGAIADRYGYKKILILSFIIYISAFLMLPIFTSVGGVFFIFIYLAIGAALFKPIISATIAKTTTDETASIGFGIFYMMVNVGAFFGPLVTLLFKGDFESVFYVSAAIISLNFIMLLFYKEPKQVKAVGDGEKKSLGATFKEIFVNMSSIVKDPSFIVFLVIVSAFWAMYNQLFFTLPVFITQWVDTSEIYRFFATYMPVVAEKYSLTPGVMDSEFIVNFDAMYIILFQVVVSSIVMKMRPLNSMVSGFFVCSIGMALTMASQSGVFTLVAIFIFALGEMAGSPKITEYIGRIAPADKKALYMGYSFIPVFLGNLMAGVISGPVYEQLSDKVLIVKRYVSDNGLKIEEGLTNNEYFDAVAQQSDLTSQELTNLLWDTYNPSNMWYVILTIGMLATLLLFIYDKTIAKKKVTK